MSSIGPEPSASSSLEDEYLRFLASGSLCFQRCEACRHAWLPPREACPNCLQERWVWEAASGRAHLVSWVVYRVALDPRYRDRVPYNVAIVELDEGPRLISNLVDVVDDRMLHINTHLRLRIDPEIGLPLFSLLPQPAR